MALTLVVVAVLFAAAFLTIGVAGSWDFVLPFRGRKLAAMIVVAIAVAVSTVLFQTVTRNRILSPAIMGFDSLYVAIQSAMVLVLGPSRLSSVDPQLRFALETLVMVGLSVLLFRWLIASHNRNIHLLVLTGVVFGVLFRSLSSLIQRLLDPNSFSVLQDLLFANFSQVDTNLLLVTATVVSAACLAAWRMANMLDVLALGRDTAIGLGIDYRRMVTAVLFIVAVLVSVSTALVGPITFFGLLVANIAYGLVQGHRHRDILPVASLLAIITVVGGQTLLEHAFGLDAALSAVIEFVGGIAFIVLLLRGVVR